MADPRADPEADLQVLSVRNVVLARVAAAGPEVYDIRDVARISVDGHYVKRFLLQYDNNRRTAVDKIMDTLNWRKSKRVNYIHANNVNAGLFATGQLVAHNRDQDGNKLLICTVRKHFRNQFTQEDLERFFVYWMERLEREEYPGKITMFFDMSNCTLQNVDLIFVRRFIDILDKYYPWFVQDVIIFEIGGFLQRVWRVIESIIPANSRNMIQMVIRSTLPQFVDKEQSLISWGGTDDFNYVAAPEQPFAALPWIPKEN